jgi:hypothetical protein
VGLKPEDHLASIVSDAGSEVMHAILTSAKGIKQIVLFLQSGEGDDVRMTHGYAIPVHIWEHITEKMKERLSKGVH